MDTSEPEGFERRLRSRLNNSGRRKELRPRNKGAYRRHLESSRCPPCRGDEVDGRVRNGGKPCFISICSCSCHAHLRGQGRGTVDRTPEEVFHGIYKARDFPNLTPKTF